MTQAELLEILTKLIAIALVLPMHEFAHAYAALKMGDTTARDQGRLTLNPLKHLSLMGTLMMLLVGIGYAKPVPVRAQNFKNPKRGMALTALAGPLSNLLMALVLYSIEKILYGCVLVTGSTAAFWSPLLSVLYLLFWINLSLAVFNLLPIPPLDGSRIIALVLPERLYFKIMRYEQIIMLALMAALFFGLLDKPLQVLQSGAQSLMDVLTRPIDWLFLYILQ